MGHPLLRLVTAALEYRPTLRELLWVEQEAVVAENERVVPQEAQLMGVVPGRLVRVYPLEQPIRAEAAEPVATLLAALVVLE